MRTQIKNNQWRIDEDTGFLTITATILKSGSLEYHRSEMGESIPDYIECDVLSLLVPDEEICCQRSLRSLEGVEVVEGHVWQDTTTVNESIGHVKGLPYYQNGYVYADLVITNKEAINKVVNGELEDISGAYDSDIVWFVKRDDHGKQSNIRYNHIALLPRGAGRAGQTVRILNQQTEARMPDITKVRLSNGQTVSVLNEDADKLAAADKEQSEKITNMVDPAKLQETLDKLAEIKAQMEALSAEKGDLEGQVKALRDQLDSALSPEQIEMAAAEMVENQEKAEKIMNSKGLKLNSGLKGFELKKHVVSQIRVANQKPLTEDELANESMIKGMFEVYAEMAQPLPTGHQVVQPSSSKIQNAAPNAAQDYKTALWGDK